jgi:hypothetical protein
LGSMPNPKKYLFHMFLFCCPVSQICATQMGTVS